MTDFRPIIMDLDAKGFGVNKIAMRIGAQFVQIQRIKEGGRATYDIGVALLNLHQEVCGPTLTIVPQTSALRMPGA